MRLAVLSLAVLTASAFAETPAPSSPVVVELFTSQSCSSCPPAEAYFTELSRRPGLLSLEWHVDYWDTLSVPGAGKWKDPYSSAAWTARQTAYNQSILKKPNVYTPQAVIAGTTEGTGFDRTAVEQKIKAAQAVPSPVRITTTKGESYTFTVTGAPKTAEAELVIFRKAVTDDIKGGENKGRKLASANVVLSDQKLGLTGPIHAALPRAGEGCALLVHGPNQGPILSAAVCPG